MFITFQDKNGKTEWLSDGPFNGYIRPMWMPMFGKRGLSKDKKVWKQHAVILKTNLQMDFAISLIN